MPVTDPPNPSSSALLSPLAEERLEAYRSAARRQQADYAESNDSGADAQSMAISPHLSGHYQTLTQQTGAARIGMWLFLATEIMMFGGLFCLYAAFRFLWPEAFHYGHQFLDTGWGLINTVILILSSFTMAVGVHCARRNQYQALMLFLTLTIMCGVCFLGVKAIEYRHKIEAGLLWGAYFRPRLAQVDATPLPAEPALAAAAPASTAAAAGDPAVGRPLYLATCIGCHGTDGEGIAGIAPTLKGSTFVKTASLEQLTAVIRDGRQPDAPDSLTNALMPARGGNPFLGDDEIRHIAAYVRALGAGEASAAGTGGPAAPVDAAAAVPRWVGTRPPQPDTGLAAEWRYDPNGLIALPASSNAVPAHAGKFFALYFLMTGLHGVHLIIAMGIVGWLLWRASRWHFNREYATPVELGGLYWHLVDLVWLFLFPLFYLVH